MAYKKQKNVNIDALIAREDFEAADETTNTASKISTLSVNDLKEGSGLFLASVRKPDFQRETADWDIDKIVRFIKSFVDGEFIPAVILWRSQAGLIFVIDGSHRLSSLIAWVNDDYGDGQFSLEAFDGEIPDEQRQIARKARETINSQIGPYSDYYKALVAKHPDPDIIVKARNLASRALQIQWIDGDVDTAERSFFNINQQATPIDPTELKLLQKRKNPNCIAARSIMRAGKGHKYWHNFSQEIQESIETLASSINRLLFDPIIQRPIKTLDLPICDRNNLFASGKTSVEVQESILANPKYQRLKLTFSPELEVTTGAFNSGNKSEVYIQEAYKKAPRCAICGGLLHTHSISIDHIQRKRDGGLGCVENGQLTHPYCNTGVKN